MSEPAASPTRTVPAEVAHAPIGAVRDAVRRALGEDLEPLGDLSAMLLPGDVSTTAAFVSRADGVLAGTRCVTETFTQLDGNVTVDWHVHDGDVIVEGQHLADVTGPLVSILSGERTALNFLGHLSGVASATAALVGILERSGDDRLRLWDTRKTTPGLRALEKAAVRAGGAQNHRGNLSEWVMLKDNHLAQVSITDAVPAAHRVWPGRLVHVECDRFDQLVTALDAGADAVLLDNMDPDQVRRCVDEVDRRIPHGERGRPLIEVSGGIDAATLASFAGCGADRVSVGAITNSAPVLDIGLDIDPTTDSGGH
ncbi:MAG TPA: carboxylating nicotinate-nucleotide diphosphorylase [Acidimicrobiales bacterium]|nr:carboxylating nicotinate-nucleotide diphosphorylase [Acidimicrobiales bacterium]